MENAPLLAIFILQNGRIQVRVGAHTVLRENQSKHSSSVSLPILYIHSNLRRVSPTMQLLKIAALQAFIAIAFAVPQSVEKRGNVGVFFCQNSNWGGLCVHQQGPAGQGSKALTFP